MDLTYYSLKTQLLCMYSYDEEHFLKKLASAQGYSMFPNFKIIPIKHLLKIKN